LPEQKMFNPKGFPDAGFQPLDQGIPGKLFIENYQGAYHFKDTACK